MESIAIVGAGPVGCLAALYLAQRGHHVSVFEARPDPHLVAPPPGRSITLTLAERGWAALRGVGVDAAIQQIVMPLRGRTIHGEDGSTRYQRYTEAGDAIYSASRSSLTARLLDLARSRPHVELHFEHRCTGADLDRRSVRFSTAHGRLEVRPDRLLAADGAYSIVRRALQHDEAAFYQRMSPLLYREVQVPASTDGRWVFDERSLHLWPRGDSMMVGFPNADGSFTVSMFLPLDGEVSFSSLSDRTDVEDFARTTCPDLFENAPNLSKDFFAAPPSMLVSSGCFPWVHEDWLALIGDAAHALVPFLGQGLNAGLEDCRVLDQCIGLSGGDWAKAFADYQTARYPNAEAAVVLAEQHYEELARNARDPSFVLRKSLEEKVHALLGDRFVPLYTMVAFQDRPYAEIKQLRERQELLLDRLVQQVPAASSTNDLDVERLILEAVDAFEREGAGVPTPAPRAAQPQTVAEPL